MLLELEHLTPTAIRTAVPIVLFVFVAALALERRRLGPQADWLEAVRHLFLPPLDAALERAIGGAGTAYQLSEQEFVEHLDRDPEAVEQLLWRRGCRRNFMAAYKTLDDGREEIGSWAYRGPAAPDRQQIHLILFPGDDGGVDVYAHREMSSWLWWLFRDPTVLVGHYQAWVYEPAPEIATRILEGRRLGDE